MSPCAAWLLILLAVLLVLVWWRYGRQAGAQDDFWRDYDD